MNKKYLIKIPLLIEKDDGNGGKEVDTSKQLNLSVNLGLTPYLISDSALLAGFVSEDEYERYRPKAREISFHASLRAHELVENKLCGFPPETKLLYARELALCYAMNDFGKHFYGGGSESLHRSKTYGEFTVTTTIKNSMYHLKGIIDDSKSCIDAIKKELDNLKGMVDGLGIPNMKGICNPGNNMSWRVWFNNNLPERSLAIFASEKVWYNGNVYKDGDNVPNTRTRYTEGTPRSPVYYY